MKDRIGPELQFLESILHNIPHMVFVKEAEELRFVLFNKAGEDLLGVSNADLMGKNDYDFFPKEQADFFVSKDRQVMSGNQVVLIEEEPIDTPHGKRILRTKKIPLKDPEGRPAYLLGISEDITEQKQQLATIEEQRVALEAHSRLGALGEMAAGIAHEINNPLSIIMGVCSRIESLSEAERLDVNALRALSTKLEATTMRISTIVEGLRDISREGKNDPFQLVHAKTLLDKVLAVCAQRLKNDGIAITIDVDPHAQLIFCQEVRLSQVLINLISNARDALLGQEKPELAITVTAAGPGRVRLSLRDNGPGIPKAIRSKIFEPFFTTKDPGKGTGLGLSISKSLVEAQGGEFALDNTCEAGAAFVIELASHPPNSVAA